MAKRQNKRGKYSHCSREKKVSPPFKGKKRLKRGE